MNWLLKIRTAERNFIKSPSGSSHSEPIQSQCLDSLGVTFKVGYEVPLLITNHCKRQVMITKAKLITMEREREIYTKMTQAFKEVYQQTHATKVGQTTSRVIILLVILTFGIDKRKLFLISSKRARKYVI